MTVVIQLISHFTFLRKVCNEMTLRLYPEHRGAAATTVKMVRLYHAAVTLLLQKLKNVLTRTKMQQGRNCIKNPHRRSPLKKCHKYDSLSLSRMYRSWNRTASARYATRLWKWQIIRKQKGLVSSVSKYPSETKTQRCSPTYPSLWHVTRIAM